MRMAMLLQFLFLLLKALMFRKMVNVLNFVTLRGMVKVLTMTVLLILTLCHLCVPPMLLLMRCASMTQKLKNMDATMKTPNDPNNAPKWLLLAAVISSAIATALTYVITNYPF